jgi:hypothetical protein
MRRLPQGGYVPLLRKRVSLRMIDVYGDLWTYDAEVRGITTNGYVDKKGACVMGRGCAYEAKQRYPGIELLLGQLIGEHGNRCFRIEQRDTTILSFPVKHNWYEKADLTLIATSCAQAVEMADHFRWQSIVLARPGAGNGQLDYDTEVRPAIAPLLDDRFHVITFGANT